MKRHPQQIPITIKQHTEPPAQPSASWWTQVRQGESMMQAAERERDRMNASKVSNRLSSTNYVGFGFGSANE